MPNEVFLRTRAGLSTMVSSRAADKILAGALKGSGHDPEAVNQSQMRSALLGPVLHELENVLPRAGLRRNLERLAKSLREPTTERETPRALLTGSIPADASRPAPVETARGVSEAIGAAPVEEGTLPEGATTGVTHAADAEVLRPEASATRPDEASNGSSRGAGADLPSPEGPFEAFAGPPATASPARPARDGGAGAAKRATPRMLRRLTEAELEERVTRFALIDHVRLVAAIRADGSVPVHRGEGLDLELLSRLCRLTHSLLAKGGELRSLHLGHSAGQLFLFPIGPDLLVLYGGGDLNLGSVTTAFTALALEEEL